MNQEHSSITTTSTTITATTTPTRDFMDDESNDYQSPSNPPYNYVDDDEWPRIERNSTILTLSI